MENKKLGITARLLPRQAKFMSEMDTRRVMLRRSALGSNTTRSSPRQVPGYAEQGDNAAPALRVSFTAHAHKEEEVGRSTSPIPFLPPF